MRPVFDWKLESRSLQLGKRTLVMGVVNVTPDSFSDGGEHFDCDRATEHALQLLQQGAAIIDVGGESTRPGVKVAAATPGTAKPGGKNPQPPKPPGISSAPVKSAVTEKEEMDRVIPVIRAIKQKHPDALISVDTYKSVVARAALEAGAEIVNDVSGLRWDSNMPKTVAELKCGVIVMHMRGKPDEWRNLPPAPDIVTLVKRELREWADIGLMAGVKRERIAVDPGFGFGKMLEQNYPLLKRLEELHQLHYPLVVGVSRKSFIGHAVARDGKDAPIPERIYGTLGAEVVAILKGAHIIRTHDVRACVDAAQLADVAV
jgi:dihydropteroate synthase